MKTVSRFFILCFFLTFLNPGNSAARAESHAARKATPENQRQPDLGDGRYLNPILGGDYPDPSVARDGDDFYLTNSSFEYYPGLLIWHSKDLVNWQPICRALNDNVGSVYAPELVKYKDTWYIYFPTKGTNWVITAPKPEGPWSKPINLKVGGIDPGHVVGPDGKRYLHLSDGNMVQLTDDGTKIVGEPRKVYYGWEYPKDWNVECFCLESPKLTFRNGYYYLTVAEGGTAGPASSHMVVSSRSKTPWGPWEHSPYNPVVHTVSKSEHWWSRGHGTLVDDAKGNWWIMYHGYEKDFHTLGRQTLMEPVEWTADNWFRVPKGTDAAKPIRTPYGAKSASGMTLSDSMTGDHLGIQWQFYKEFAPDRLSFTPQGMVMQARGTSPTDSAPLLCVPMNHAYEITIEAEISEKATAGLLLFYSPLSYCGIGVDKDSILTCLRGSIRVQDKNRIGSHIHFKVINDCHEVSSYYSADGKTWTKLDRSLDVSGYNHNTFGGFLSLRAGFFAGGEGTVTFRNFTYKGL